MRFSRFAACALFIGVSGLTTAASSDTIVPGGIQGKFDVTAAGSASYVIPIRVAPGTAGTEPKISFVYDSQAPSGALGAGWSIAGISKITRGPKNLRTDGIFDGVRLDRNDALYLDGQRLIPVTPTGGGVTEIQFVKEMDDQTRVTAVGIGPQGPSGFIVQTKAGLTMTYGVIDKSRGTDDSLIRFKDGTIFLWVCNRITDSAGNYIKFSYRQNNEGDYNVASIEYTGNDRAGLSPYASVDFEYETVRPAEAYVAGKKLTKDARLKKVTSSAFKSAVTRYELRYDDTDTLNRFVLRGIKQFGSDDTRFEETKLDYSTPLPADKEVWDQAKSGYGNIGVDITPAKDNVAAGYRFVEIDLGAGPRTHVLYGAELQGRRETFGLTNTGSEFKSTDALKAPPVVFVTDGRDLGVQIVDLDNNKQPYLFASNPGQPYAFAYQFNKTTGAWDDVSTAYQLPMNDAGAQPARILVGDLDGDGKPDIVWAGGNDTTTGKSGVLLNTGSGLKGPAAGSWTLPYPLSRASRLLNADCDNKDTKELAFYGSGRSETFQYDAAAGWKPADAKYNLPSGLANISAAAIRDVQLPNKCLLLMVASDAPAKKETYLADNANGWQRAASHDPQFVFVDAAGDDVRAQIIDADPASKEIVAHWQGSGTTKYAAIVNETGIRLDQNRIPERPLATRGQTFSPTFIGKINGDDFPDVIYLSNAPQQRNEVFFYEPAGSPFWKPQRNYVPDIPFARQDKENLGVRFVDLHGTGRQDLIYRRDKDGKPVEQGAKRNTGSDWKEDKDFYPPVPFAAEYRLNNAAQFVDVNGDGRLDLVFSLKRKGESDDPNNGIYLNTGSGGWGLKDANFKLPDGVYLAHETKGDLGVRFIDLDGDGRMDILIARLNEGSAPTREAYRNTGSGWVRWTEYDPPGPFFVIWGGLASPPRAYFMDMHVQFMDADGNGLPDLVYNYQDPRGGTVKGVCLNTGKGWNANCSTIDVPLALDEVERNFNRTIQYLDLNGDGLVDIVVTDLQGPQCSKTDNSKTYLGTGAGWLESKSWQVPVEAISPDPGDPGFRLLDVNGDGVPDIIFNRPPSCGSDRAGTFINTGGGWKPGPPRAKPPQLLSGADGADTGARLVDVNGDGLPDLIMSFLDGNIRRTGAWLNQNRRADVLIGVTDGMGVKTAVCYQTLGELQQKKTCNEPFVQTKMEVAAQQGDLVAAYHPRSGPELKYPFIAAVPSTYVATSVTIQEPKASKLSFAYQYGNLGFDAHARRSLGFAWRSSTDEQKQVTSRLVFEQQDRWKRGLIICSETIFRNSNAPSSDSRCNDQEAPGTLGRSKTDWEVRTRPHTIGGITYMIAQVAQKRVQTTTHDLKSLDLGGQVDDFDYDDYLNVKKSVTTRAETNGKTTSITTVNVYDNDTTRWFLGRLKESTVTKVGDRNQQESRQATFAYHAQTGLLRRETANAGDPKAVTIDYDRDDFGNVFLSRTTASSETPRITTRQFDWYGRFALSETNPAGHTVQKEYTQGLGQTSVATDPNGLKTRFEYDGFGRLSKRTDPTGVVTTFKYEFIAQSDAIKKNRDTALFQVTAKTQGLEPVISLFDARSRLVRKVTVGFGAGGRIFADNDYDVYGRVLAESRPYFETNGTLFRITREYDEFDRILKTIQPDNTTETTVEYKGRITVVTGMNGRKKVTRTTTTNVRNAPTQVVDAAGGVTEYEYDAGDRLSKIVGPMKATTEHTYDSVGHRKSTTDPDLRGWSYGYNPFGELVSQTDAKKQTIVLDYDTLGRPIRRHLLGERMDTWDYDAPGAIGMLAAAASTNGYVEQYSYDAFGRLKEKKTRIGSELFTSNTEYDEYGRTKLSYYPVYKDAERLVIENIYDASGHLKEVRNKDTAALYWSARDIDASGRVLKEHLGATSSGVNVERTFKASTGQLETMTSSAQTGARIQNLKLDYDLANNLTNHIDHITGVTTTFEYDDLERLTKVDPSNASAKVFTYDQAGRIKSKTDVGTFTYDPKLAPYHGVLTTSLANPKIEQRNEYDENGNRTRQRRERAGNEEFDVNLEYTADNRLTRICQGKCSPHDYGNYWTRFDYAPDGQRFRQFARDGGDTTETIYAGLYERVGRLFLGSRSDQHRHYLVSSTGVFGFVEFNTTSVKGALPLAQNPKPQSAARPQAPRPPLAEVAFQTDRTRFLIKDQLGSVTRLVNENGSVGAQFVYDAWGSTTSNFGRDWSRGYTGHEEVQVGKINGPPTRFVHMNGRVYDPDTSSFLSPDLMIQLLTDSRSLNRFSYVLNNPYKYIDPTGYGFWGDVGDFFGGVGQAIGNIGQAIGGAVQDIGQALGGAAKWLEQNWREVVIIAAAIVVTVLTAGTTSPILAGMVAGAVSGGLGSALYGGSTSDVLLAAFKGGVFGAMSAGIGEAFAAGSWGNILAEGHLRGVEAASEGRDYWRAFGEYALTGLAPSIGEIKGFDGAMALRIGAQAALSGTIASLEGGKFANGAYWGAFTQLQIDANSFRWSEGIQSRPVVALIDAAQYVARDATSMVARINAAPLALRGIVAASLVSTTARAIEFAGGYDFRTSVDFVGLNNQLMKDPFTMAGAAFGAPSVRDDIRAYQSLGSALYGQYSYQLAPIGIYNNNWMYSWQGQSSPAWRPF